MRKTPTLDAAILATCVMMIIWQSHAAGAPRKAVPAPGRSIAVLDPVDLEYMSSSRESGRDLRRIFSGLPAWRVHPVDSMEAKLREYRINPLDPCHEFQCAFDAGNVLLTEFVAFSTVTTVGGWQTFTLNLVYVPRSLIVFSQAGEVKRGGGTNPGEALEGALKKLLANVDPSALDTRKREKKGLVTVLELGPGLGASRVLADRLSTHIHGTRSYDIMTQREQGELLAALEIDKSRALPTDSSLFWLGGKMGVSHLLSSRLSSGDGGFKLGLALYDIAEKKKVREWPSQSRDDFRKLLLVEEKFFSGLFRDQGPVASGRNGDRDLKTWYRAGAGLGVTVSVAAAVGAYWADRESDKQYVRYQGALSSGTAASYRRKVESKDREALALGGTSALFLLLSAASLTLSF